MSDDDDDPIPPSQIKASLVSPQVLAALITALAALIVALVPTLTNNATTAPIPTPTPPPTFTPAPPTAAATPIPPTATVEVTVTAFPLPTEITVLPSQPDTPQLEQSSTANVLLIYDDASFTIYNQDSRTLSLSDIVFTSSGGRWEARAWGPSLARSFPADTCLRLRNAASGQRQPPAICGGNLYGLQLVGPQALFWRSTNAFEVTHKGEVIATCRTDAGECRVFIP